MTLEKSSFDSAQDDFIFYIGVLWQTHLEIRPLYLASLAGVSRHLCYQIQNVVQDVVQKSHVGRNPLVVPPFFGRSQCEQPYSVFCNLLFTQFASPPTTINS